MDKELAQKVLDQLNRSAHDGHDFSCGAIKGPGTENWIEEDDCTCGLRELKILLELEVSNDSSNHT